MGLGADLGVVVAFGQLIRPHVLAALPMVNLHFSLLPRWRGAAPVERALLAGDRETGVCLMQVEHGLDTGGVFAREVVPIGERVTAVELRAELVTVGARAARRLAHGRARGAAAATGRAGVRGEDRPAELRIDWSRPAVELDRLVRLGGAWSTLPVEADQDRGRRPVAWEHVDGSRWTQRWTGSSRSTGAGGRAAEPGHLSAAGIVSCGTGALALRVVQPEGKAPMPFAAWANGARPQPDERFGS